MPIYIISILIQLLLIVHVMKTGRATIWIYLLLFVPLVGGLAYFLVELLPDLWHSRTGGVVRRNVNRTINPDRELKAAYHKLDKADTIDNNMKLAEQCLLRERFEEAKTLYERCRTGLFTHDPQILLGLAKAHFGLKDYGHTIALLDELKEKNPDHTSPDGHLLYACAQEQAGNIDAAIHEYETLVQYYPSPEPACRLGLLLKARGETQKAQELFAMIVKKSRVAGKHFNTINKPWIAIAKREV